MKSININLSVNQRGLDPQNNTGSKLSGLSKLWHKITVPFICNTSKVGRVPISMRNSSNTDINFKNTFLKNIFKGSEIKIQNNIEFANQIAKGNGSSSRFEALKFLCLIESGAAESEVVNNAAQDIYKLVKLLDLVKNNKVSPAVMQDRNKINQILERYTNSLNSGYCINFSQTQDDLEKAIKTFADNLNKDNILSKSMKNVLPEITRNAVESMEKLQIERNITRAERAENGNGSSQRLEALKLLYDPPDLYPNPDSGTFNAGQHVAKNIFRLAMLIDDANTSNVSPAAMNDVNNIKKILNDNKNPRVDADIRRTQNALKNAIQSLSNNLKNGNILTNVLKEKAEAAREFIEAFEIKENVMDGDSMVNVNGSSSRLKALKDIYNSEEITKRQNPKTLEAAQNAAQEIYKLEKLTDLVIKNRASPRVMQNVKDFREILSTYRKQAESGAEINSKLIKNDLKDAIQSLSSSIKEEDKSLDNSLSQTSLSQTSLSQTMSKNLGVKVENAIKAITKFEKLLNTITDSELVTKKLEKELKYAEDEMKNEKPKERFKVDSDKINELTKESENKYNKGKIKAETLVVGELKVGVASVQGQRGNMEDEHDARLLKLNINGKNCEVPYFAVFDGHGERFDDNKAAKYAQKNMPEILQKTFSENINLSKDQDTIIWNSLKQACVKLDEAFKNDHKELGNQGTTAVFSLVIAGKLWTANVGDSRAILLRGSETIALTSDAKPGNPRFAKGVEQRGGQIGMAGVLRVSNYVQDFDGMKVAFDGVAVARAIGDADIKKGISARPKITCINNWNPKTDKLILACDGPFEVASREQVAELVLYNANEERLSPGVNAKSVIEHAAASGDNMTVMVVEARKKVGFSDNHQT